MGNEGERTNQRTVVVVPCYNEEPTIGKVIADFRHELPGADVIVIDNNSTDASSAIAEKAGATVLHEKRQGKGYVVRSMFDWIDADVYIMVDGDDTYAAKDVHKLMEPVLNDDADMVVGSRLEELTGESMNALHRFGNRLLLAIIRLTFRVRLKDMLSGYRVMNRTFVQGVPTLSAGFEIETEISIQAMERGMRIRELPIEYRARPEGSTSKLRPFRDGTRILSTIMSIFRDYRPLAFFSSIAGVIFLVALIIGGVVIADYIESGIVRRLPLAVLSTSLAILSFLVLITGFIVGTINRRFSEMHVLLSRQFRGKSK